jgi:hypothetical protein
LKDCCSSEFSFPADSYKGLNAPFAQVREEGAFMPDAAGDASGPDFSFAEFNRRIDQLPDFEDQNKPTSCLAKHAWWVAGVSFLIGTAFTRLPLPPKVQLIGAAAALLVEVSFIGIQVWFTARHDIPGIVSPKREFACKLDFDLEHHYELLGWLEQMPTAVLTRYRDFTKYRRARMEQKLPLLIGNVQMLGVLPLVVAIFLQVRDFHKNHHIGLIEGLASLVLAFFYFLCWSMAVVKQRLDAMDMLLEEAMRLKTIAELKMQLPAI